MASLSRNAIGEGASRALLIASLVCVVTVVATAGALVVPAVAARLGWTSTTVRPAYEVGSRIDVPASLYADRARTVLVFGRSSCGACERAKPMLSSAIREVTRESSVSVAMVAGAGATAADRQFARDLGIPEDRFFTLDVQSLKLERVPTLVLVDQRGTVLFEREGTLDQTHFDQLLSAAGVPSLSR